MLPIAGSSDRKVLQAMATDAAAHSLELFHVSGVQRSAKDSYVVHHCCLLPSLVVLNE